MANNSQFSGVQPHQPPIVGSMDPPRSFVPPMSIQFRPVVPAQQSQQFIPVASQQFQPLGRGFPVMNTGFPPPPQTQQPQFSQFVQQLPARPGQPGHVLLPPQVIPMPNAQPNRPMTSGVLQPQPNVQTPNNYTPGLGGPGAPLSSSYTFAPSSYGQPQITANTLTQYQSMPQMHAPSIPTGGQVGLSVSQSTASVIPLQHNGEQSSITTATVSAASVQSKPTEVVVTEWVEHTSNDGRRYYHNKRTRQSSWEKPLELMTPIERADASTDWKEFTSPDGRIYYYNKVTNQSKWSIPEELKLAREQVEKASIKGTQTEMFANSHAPASVPSSEVKAPTSADASSSPAVQGVASSPVLVAPVVAVDNVQPVMVSGSSALPVVASSMTTKADVVASSMTTKADIVASSMTTKADGVQTTVDTVTTFAAVSESAGVAVSMVNAVASPMNDLSNHSAEENVSTADGIPAQDKEEASKDVVIGEKSNNSLEQKAVEQEPLTYANKLEAKNAFKELLESTNVGSDWTWDQAMRAIINDRRYGALKTLGERKQAFNEFLVQKKKQDVEERRIKQKKAREEYKKMLEEFRDMTSSTRWSKVVTMFEDDERFKAVEREKDRRDLFEDYLNELRQKERAKAQEERKQNIMEYRQFLESCDFIKASTQWRKVQDLLEADERCSRLEKIDRLEIFQEYLNDLEREEEEKRKIQKEELRKAERKNRDEFRKLMEGHVVAGTLTAKTHWRDYCMKVKDLPAYLAVSSNTSGSTPKDLFEDVAEELQKQYHEDKTRIKDAVKLGKITLSSSWTLEDLKAAAIAEGVSSPPISDVNLKLVFDELLERVREKEEKEAKKRKRLADDFLDLLHSTKEITSSSKWENFKPLFEGSQEYSSIGEESLCKGIFEEYTMQLKEQAKENERKRKEEKAKKEKEREERERRKVKHGREKERGREREKEDNIKKDIADSENADIAEIYVSSENKKWEKDNNKKHRKRHQSTADNLNEYEKDRSKDSNRHSSDHKKSRRHASTPESDSESRHKRHKRDHRNGSRRHGDHGELEDGEFGEDKESR